MASLLQPHTGVSMRTTSNKDYEIFDLDGLFDQYVETDLLQQFSDTTADPSSSDDMAHLFEPLESNGSESIEPSPMPDWDADADAWHQAIRILRQNPALPTIPSNSCSVYPESHGSVSLSNPELLSFGDLFELDLVNPRLSTSTPSTPKAQTTTSPKIPQRPARHRFQKSAKKSSTISRIAKMMRSSHYRPGFQDLWTRKMDGAGDMIDLEIPPNSLPQSPPPSSKAFQDQSLYEMYPQDQPYTIAMSPVPYEPTTPDLNYQLTPLSSPAIDQNSRQSNGYSSQLSSDPMASAYISSQMSHAALSALQTPPSSHRLPMAPWDTDTPASLSFDFLASPEPHSQSTGKIAGWWNDNNNQPSEPTPNYLPSQSRSSSQTMTGFSTASVAGLGITCDIASFSGFGPELHTENGNGEYAAAPAFDIGFPMYHADNGYPIGQPLRRHTPSRSPSMSPQPQFTRRRHSSNRTQTTTHQRRKSSNSSSNQSTGKASVGFVNYTPDDSKKILTGVAPSGSSKTKARREKEAADKRRKLSQAAVKAIIEAGGDLGRLEKEGLIDMDS
jgi:hypothetical protein